MLVTNTKIRLESLSCMLNFYPSVILHWSQARHRVGTHSSKGHKWHGSQPAHWYCTLDHPSHAGWKSWSPTEYRSVTEEEKCQREGRKASVFSSKKGLLAHICDPAPRTLRQEDWGFKVTLWHQMRLFLYGSKQRRKDCLQGEECDCGLNLLPQQSDEPQCAAPPAVDSD